MPKKKKKKASNNELGFQIEIASSYAEATAEGIEDRVVDASKAGLTAVAEVAKTCADVFIREISKLATRPKEIEMEFGVNIGIEGGLPMITKASAEGNFSITLKWELN